MQSHIILKFREEENVNKKEKEKVTVRQDMLNKIDDTYILLSDNKNEPQTSRNFTRKYV